MFKITKKAFIYSATSLCLIITSCAPVVRERGNNVKDEQVTSLQPGVSTKSDVLSSLGSPTTRSSLNGETWYYVSKKTERLAFFEPETLEQKVVAINFNTNGVVDKIKKKGLEDKKDIEIVSRKTPTAGKDMSIMEQLIGNIGRFNKDDVE